MDTPEITFGRYEGSLSETDITEEANATSIAVMGLAGEIGDLLSQFKKELRGDIASNHRRGAVCEEIGDCLWYLAKVCQVQGKSLSEVVKQRKRTSIDILLDDESAQNLESAELASKFIVQLGRLVSLLSENQNLEDGISELAVLLASTAKSFDLTLSEVADFNIKKTRKRFSDDYSELMFFDDSFPEFEQLPRQLTVDIREEKVGKEVKAMLFINDYILGNPLDDNISGTPDHYRYHDVFHLAFVANLWWSPNLRALLSRKRKSNFSVDKNEDGGRARVMEEGIVHLVFRYGEENDFFRGIEEPRVDASLLNSIEAMVKGFEVEDRPLSLWNKAICDAFSIFLQIRDNRSGQVKIDMRERNIVFERN